MKANTSKRIGNNSRMRKAGRFVVLALILAMIFPATVISERYEAQAASGVRIAQAKVGEKGLKGNKPGDQTGREFRIDNYSYSMLSFASEHWVYVFRARNPETARTIAQKMTEAAESKYVGYDQNIPDRGSFYEEAKKVGWDIPSIKTKCETTCAGAISVCLNAVGIKVPKYLYTGRMHDVLMDTGEFYCFSSKEYVTSSSKLVVGDILLNPGKHTAMVIESPNPFTCRITFTNTSGEKKKAYIAEDSTLTLNLNNGEKPLKLDIKTETNLKKYIPKKEDYEFVGWSRPEKNVFSARFKSALPAIETINEEVDITK